MSMAAPRPARLPLVSWVLAGGTFLMATSEFLVAGLLPQVASDFHVDIPQAGLSITVFAIGMIIGSPTMVLLTLRLPRRRTLTLALVIFAIGHVISALSLQFGVLLGARFLTAIATGAFWAVAGLVAAEAAGPGAGTRALGVVQSGGMLATVLGVPLGAVSGQLLGWRAPFWILTGLALIAAVVVHRLVPEDHGSRPVPTIRKELAVLRVPQLWLVLATCALVTGGVLSVYSYISPLLTGRTGLAEGTVPLALLLFGAAGLAGTLIIGRLGDRHPYRAALVVASLTFVTTIALALVSRLPIPTLILFGLLGLTGLSMNPVLGYLAIRFGGSAPTLASALTPSAFNLGTAVGTGITSAALRTGLGDFAPLVVGGVGAALVLVVFGTLAGSVRRANGGPLRRTA